MKIIDLLNKIANGEEVPKKIIIDGKLLFLENGKEFAYRFESGLGTLNWDYYIERKKLNDEIEIIEESKKIEKIELIQHDFYDAGIEARQSINKTREKLNEIIDYINKGDSDE